MDRKQYFIQLYHIGAQILSHHQDCEASSLVIHIKTMDTALEDAFIHLRQENGLVILAKGLGLSRLIMKCIQFYQQNPHHLVFIINCSSTFPDLLRQGFYSEGYLPSQIPMFINNEIPIDERLHLYQHPRCYFITSRILLMDMLSKKLDVQLIQGMMICNAHNYHEVSMEAFIVRLYRQVNKTGFIYAFSDESDHLSREYGSMTRLLKYMYLRKIYSYPRNIPLISNILNSKQPNLMEYSLQLTPLMKSIQSALFIAMETCIKEISKSCSLLQVEQLDVNTLYNYDFVIKKQLDSQWYKVSPHTKQLISDLGSIRQLFDYLLQYDAIDFYHYLCLLKSSALTNIPLWLTTYAAEVIFQKAKQRVYSLETNIAQSNSIFTRFIREQLHCNLTLLPKLEILPKWRILVEILSEISKKDRGGRVLILVKNERTALQLKEAIAKTPASVMEERYRVFVSEQCALVRSQYPKSCQQNNPLGLEYSVAELQKMSVEHRLLLVEVVTS